MQARAAAPLAEASPPTPAGAPAARKARFRDRIAVPYAADPIADMAGHEITLRRVRGPLSADQNVLEIGCGTGITALGLALFTRRLLAIDLDQALELAMRALRPRRLISKTACISELNPLIPHLAPPLMRAVGKAAPVLRFDADVLQSVVTRQGKDFRGFIVARKPG